MNRYSSFAVQLDATGTSTPAPAAQPIRTLRESSIVSELPRRQGCPGKLGSGECVVAPGKSRGAIDQPMVGGIAEATAQRAGKLHGLGVARLADKGRDDRLAAGNRIRERYVGLDAEHESRREHMAVAGLQSAEIASGPLEGFEHVEEVERAAQRRRGASCGPIGPAPGIAKMRADIKPAPGRGWRDRGFDPGRGHIGSPCHAASGQRNEHHATSNGFVHGSSHSLARALMEACDTPMKPTVCRATPPRSLAVLTDAARHATEPTIAPDNRRSLQMQLIRN